MRFIQGKLRAKKFALTMTQTNIWSFLGLAGYYWSFVDVFASISSPLNTLN